jgi:hypothetical protein
VAAILIERGGRDGRTRELRMEVPPNMCSSLAPAIGGVPMPAVGLWLLTPWITLNLHRCDSPDIVWWNT